MFLPEDCPLVDHIIKSYKKHYIGKQSLISVVIKPKPRKQPEIVRLPGPLHHSDKQMSGKTDRPVS